MTEEQQPTTDSTPDPVRRITRYLMIIVAILFIWYITADRIAPWTDQARVQAYVIPVVPQVSGRVIEVNVVKDQAVEPGHVLLRIDPTDYELAVQAAEAALELAGQEIVGEFTVRYLNRLSDALFVMARFENARKGVPEPVWDSHA